MVDIVTLEKTIKRAIPVTHLEIEDQSSGCGERYAIVLVSEDFEGLNTLKRHKMMYKLLAEHITQMHALSLTTYAPKEYDDRQAKAESEPAIISE